MELLSVIVGLESLKNPGSDITVFSDSKYVIDSITKGWVFGWVAGVYMEQPRRCMWLAWPSGPI